MLDMSDIPRQAEPVSELARKLHADLLDAVPPVNYDEALTVLAYLENEYTSAMSRDEPDSFLLPESFAPQDLLRDLFEQAFPMLDFDGKGPDDHDAFYQRCCNVYPGMKRVADSHRAPVHAKLKGIDQLVGWLNRDCADKPGRISRPISRKDSFTGQY